MVEFLEEDYEEERELVLIGVNGIWSVFELQGPTPKNDFCRILSRASVLDPLSLVLSRSTLFPPVQTTVLGSLFPASARMSLSTQARCTGSRPTSYSGLSRTGEGLRGGKGREDKGGSELHGGLLSCVVRVLEGGEELSGWGRRWSTRGDAAGICILVPQAEPGPTSNVSTNPTRQHRTCH